MIKKLLFILLLVLLMQSISFAQDILYDDLNSCFRYDIDSSLIHPIIDSGFVMHYTSEEGWENIMNMDMLLIIEPADTYSTIVKRLIQDFSMQGGNILVETCLGDVSPELNNLLSDTGWETTMRCYLPDTLNLLGGENFYFCKLNSIG